MEKLIEKFLNINYGSGYGSGDGSGDGSGSGYGYGYGSGYGIKNFNSKKVYKIDGLQTIINHIRGNVVKGFILQKDLTLTPCYIVKQDNLFAHGSTLKEAQDALQKKIFEDLDIDKRIDMFLSEFNTGTKYPAKSFYNWHNKLTGSCELGRDLFVKDNNIDLDNGVYTVKEFIALTENSYGGDIIKQIKGKINGAE